MITHEDTLYAFLQRNPKHKALAEIFSENEYEIVSHFPVKGYDDTFAVNLESSDGISIYFEYIEDLTPSSSQRMRYRVFADNDIIVKKKGKPILLNLEEVTALSHLLKEFVYQYNSNSVEFLKSKKDIVKVKIDLKKALLDGKKDFQKFIIEKNAPKHVRVQALKEEKKVNRLMFKTLRLHKYPTFVKIMMKIASVLILVVGVSA